MRNFFAPVKAHGLMGFFWDQENHFRERILARWVTGEP